MGLGTYLQGSIRALNTRDDTESDDFAPNFNIKFQLPQKIIQTTNHPT